MIRALYGQGDRVTWRAKDLAVRTVAAVVISAALLSFNFTSSALAKTPRPAVTKVSPTTGTTKGGTAVTISGSSFTHVKYVLFGKDKGTKLKTVSSHEIKVDAPAHGAGKVSITVVAKAGSSKTSSKTEFTYKTPPPPPPAAGTLAVFAGVAHTVTPGPATATPLGASIDSSVTDGVAADSHGNFYIADASDNVIEEVTPSGTLSIIAGIPGFAGPSQPGPATRSPLNHPQGVAVDSNGDVYVADTYNDTVEEIVPSATPGDPGTLSIIAGEPAQYGSPTAGPATSSDLDDPTSVAVDGSGDVFIANTYNDTILEVVPSGTAGVPGTLSVVAGEPGQQGAPATGTVAATSSKLFQPHGVAVDGANVYVADTFSDVIEEFTVGGDISIIAGKSGTEGAPTNDGPATSSALYEPWGVAVDSSGDVFIADEYNYRVEEVVSGTLYVIAGTGGGYKPIAGNALDSPVGNATSVAVDSTSGDVYIADSYAPLVEEVQPSVSGPSSPGTLSVVAGFVTIGPPTAGPATHSTLNAPAAVAVDSHGNVYIADQYNEDIEEVTPAGQLSIVAGDGGYGSPNSSGPATSSPLEEPTGVSVNSHGDIYIADGEAHEVLEVVPSATAGQPGTISVLAGNGSSGPPQGGLATSSPLENPSAVAVNSSGDVFFTDGGTNVSGANTVDEVVPSSTPGDPGTLSVIAGIPGEHGVPTSGPATSSLLNEPQGIAAANNGDIYIADTGNDTIDEVVPSKIAGDPGTLSIVAGQPGDSNWPIQGPAFESYLGAPQGVSVAGNGTLYITDDNTVDEITPATTTDPAAYLTIIAGHIGVSGPPRPGLAIDSELGDPTGVAVDSSGNVYIADFENNDVEEVFAK
jgi:hypothetical protein